MKFSILRYGDFRGYRYPLVIDVKGCIQAHTYMKQNKILSSFPQQLLLQVRARIFHHGIRNHTLISSCSTYWSEPEQAPH